MKVRYKILLSVLWVLFLWVIATVFNPFKKTPEQLERCKPGTYLSFNRQENKFVCLPAPADSPIPRIEAPPVPPPKMNDITGDGVSWTINTPPIERYTLTSNPTDKTLSLAHAEKVLAIIHADGSVELHGSPNAAARAFWKTVEATFPCKLRLSSQTDGAVSRHNSSHTETGAKPHEPVLSYSND